MKRGILRKLADMFALHSCDNMSDQGIEESLDVVPVLKPIKGAQNATISINNGENCYFPIKIGNLLKPSIHDQLEKINLVCISPLCIIEMHFQYQYALAG